LAWQDLVDFKLIFIKNKYSRVIRPCHINFAKVV
jgi:hypothetical protein